MSPIPDEYLRVDCMPLSVRGSVRLRGRVSLGMGWRGQGVGEVRVSRVFESGGFERMFDAGPWSSYSCSIGQGVYNGLITILG